MMTTDHFCFYLQNRLIQTGQIGGQLYSDTSFLYCSLVIVSYKMAGRQNDLAPLEKNLTHFNNFSSDEISSAKVTQPSRDTVSAEKNRFQVFWSKTIWP